MKLSATPSALRAANPKFGSTSFGFSWPCYGFNGPNPNFSDKIKAADFPTNPTVLALGELSNNLFMQVEIPNLKDQYTSRCNPFAGIGTLRLFNSHSLQAPLEQQNTIFAAPFIVPYINQQGTINTQGLITNIKALLRYLLPVIQTIPKGTGYVR